MIWLLDLLFFGTAVSLVLLAEPLLAKGRGRVRKRLRELKEAGYQEVTGKEPPRSFTGRVLKPALAGLGNSLANLAPGEIRNLVAQKLLYAGSSGGFGAESFMALQALLGGLCFCGGAVLAGLTGLSGLRTGMVALLCAAAGVLVPVIALNAKVLRRQGEIERMLPDMLDLLLVSVEAGLSFDMALQRVAAQMSGTLSDEVGRVLDEIRMGKIREEALRSLVKRTGVQDLGTFVSAVIQAEQLGSNIAGTLRIQAASMRGKRRQRAEEAAVKAPVKMLFPMIFLILPALFVVLLGPALIKLTEIFKSLL